MATERPRASIRASSAAPGPARGAGGMQLVPDDARLLDRIARGDDARDALRTLYERHAAAVLALARRLLPRGDGAEDVLQETFLAAARSAAGFASGSARPWLLTIAAHRVRDVLRSGRRRRAREERAARPETTDAAAPDAAADPALAAALGALPPSWRAAVELRFDQGLTHAETARVLGVPLRTAKDWTRRGLDRLRERLGPADGTTDTKGPSWTNAI